MTLVSRRQLGICGAALWLMGAVGCTTWTSVHGGYGHALSSSRSVAGVEVSRARGGSIHSASWLVGLRVDGSAHQFDAEVHMGAMRPLRLSERVTLAPFVTVELARMSHLAGRWYGGALGPGLGMEFALWLWIDRRDYRDGAIFGCMGGAPGIDCPRRCRVQDVTRSGIGIRAAAEYDMRFGRDYPDSSDWMSWLTVGPVRAASIREHACCYYDDGRPSQADCPPEGLPAGYPVPLR